MMDTFARITEKHDLILMSLPPSARLLYTWLLQKCPAGRVRQVYLPEFQEQSGKGRKRP